MHVGASAGAPDAGRVLLPGVGGSPGACRTGPYLRWQRRHASCLLLAPRLPTRRRYHPRLDVLYVLSECIDTEGTLTAFAVDTATGALQLLGHLGMTGRSTCYNSFDAGARHAAITHSRRGRARNVMGGDCVHGRLAHAVA